MVDEYNYLPKAEFKTQKTHKVKEFNHALTRYYCKRLSFYCID